MYIMDYTRTDLIKTLVNNNVNINFNTNHIETGETLFLWSIRKNKTELIDLIPKNQIYLATDFIQDLISMNKKVTSYSLMDYWLDIGSHSDFERAQKDIKSRSF